LKKKFENLRKKGGKSDEKKLWSENCIKRKLSSMKGCEHNSPPHEEVVIEQL